MKFYVFALLLQLFSAHVWALEADHEPTNTWVVRLDSNNEALARELADTHSFSFVGRAFPQRNGELSHFFVFESESPESSHADRLPAGTRRRVGEKDVTIELIEQQIRKPNRLHKRVWSEPSDPLFSDQWHLNGGNAEVRTNINVEAVWEDGFTGVGVTVAVVDDGVQREHPDLALNFNAAGSYDFVRNQTSPDPENWEPHGTEVAGLVAAVRNDNTDEASCGVGVAYGSKLSGIRLLGGAVTDYEEALAIVYGAETENDIFVCAFGPADDGSVHGGPGTLTSAALQDAVMFQSGREGKGSIYVWAAGNGYHASDNCNQDGYVNRFETIAVAAVGSDGRRAHYSEECTSILVTAPSSSSTVYLTTTDLLGRAGQDYGACSRQMGGTSAAAPLVAGVVALMLEANEDLSWRDVRAILIESAVKVDPNSKSWTTNAANYDYSVSYGFGLVDAVAAVELAKGWNGLPQRTRNAISYTFPYGEVFLHSHPQSFDGTYAMSGTCEHVSLYLDGDAILGDLTVTLTSPSGTVSPIFTGSSTNFEKLSHNNGWTVTSLQFYGEQVQGTWTVTVQSDSNGDKIDEIRLTIDQMQTD